MPEPLVSVPVAIKGNRSKDGADGGATWKDD
jgi:hypothetical protein